MKNKYSLASGQWWLLALWAMMFIRPVLAQTSQPPVIQWQRVLEPVNPGDANGRSAIIRNGQGGYSVLTADRRLISLTTSGDVLNDTPLTLVSTDGRVTPALSAVSPVLSSDGAIVIGILSQNEGWKLQKRNVSGEVIWTSSVPFSLSRDYQYAVSSVVSHADGGFSVFATRYDNTYADPFTPIATYVIVSRYSSTGYFLGDSQLRYETTENNLIYTNGTRVNKAIGTPDGGFLVVGSANPTSSNNTLRGWAAKLDREGKVVWQNRYESMNSLDDAAISSTGSYLLSGSAMSTPAGLFSASVLRVDASGNPGSNVPVLVPYPAFNSLASITSTASGYIIGNDTNQGVNNGDIRLTNFSEQGAIIWTKTLGGSGRDFNFTPGVLVTNDGYVVVGQTASTDGDVRGKQSTNVANWIVKLQNPTNVLTLTQPTYNCQTGAITFNTTGGDGSTITYSAPGISRANPTDNFGTVEQGLRNDPKPITITATQSGYTTSYGFDLKQFCAEVGNVLPPVLTGPIPDQVLVVGQDIVPGSVDLGKYFRDPNGFPRYRPFWAITSSGLPEGVGLATRDLDENVSPFISLFGTPVRTGSYTVTINAALPKLGVSTTASFKIIVRDSNTNPPSGATLTLIQPTYNCQTGAITFNTTGGDGSSITYSAPGISRANVTDNFGTVEQGLRNDPKPITITATQSGYSTSFTFNFGAYCGSLPTDGQLQLLAPTVTCGSLDATVIIRTSGGDGSPITYSVPGATLSSPASNTASVFQCINAESPLVAIQATQSGYTATYSLDLYKACPNTQFGQPLMARQIPDLTLSVGQNFQSYDVSSFFSDPNRFPRYPFIAQYSFSATGMPEGVTYSTEGTRNNILVAKFLGTAPSRPGVYTVTITAGNTFCGPVVTSFKIIVVDQPRSNPLALTAPTYDCQTGAFTFNTSGGDGSLIEFQAAGITGWTTNPNQSVDQESRTANDVKPFTLMARQNGQVVTYTWDLKAACGRGSGRLRTAEPGNELSVSVLGNPVVEQVRVVVRGAEGQPLRLSLSDAQGHLLENRSVDRAGSAEEQTFDVGQQAPGLLLLRTTTDTQTRTIKIIKR